MYLRLFEVLLLVFIAYAIVSQVIVPAARGTRLFPWFRREKKLLDDITEANQGIRERELEEVLRQRRDAGAETQPGPDVPEDHQPATTKDKA